VASRHFIVFPERRFGRNLGERGRQFFLVFNGGRADVEHIYFDLWLLRLLSACYGCANCQARNQDSRREHGEIVSGEGRCELRAASSEQAS